MSTQPDILLIVLDTLRRDRLSAYGYHRETSPHFDAFAQQATLFDRAVSPAQWTVPSHASIFTGLYATTHQLTEAHRTLPNHYPTLAETLRAGGYRTVGFCNNPLVGVLKNGLQRGFDEFYNYAGAAPNRPLQTRRYGLPRPLARGWQRFAREVSNQFAQQYWLFRASLHPLLTPIWTRTVNYKGHTERSINDLIAVMQQHRQYDHRQPLFSFLNLMGAHLPYRPPRDWLDHLAPDVRRDRRAMNFIARFNADAARWASPVEEPLADWQRHAIDAFYDAEIAYQDAQLGHLLDDLRQSGALDNTMVIIMADHGEGHGDHNFFGHSFVVYQELVHVPLLIHYPDHFPVGKRVTSNVSTRRVFHTVLEAAGVTPPLAEDDPNRDVTGLSLARATNCKPDTEHDLAFAEAFPPQTFLSVLKYRSPATIDRLKLTEVRRGVYDGGHKLAVVGEAVEGLFDVTDDPAELRDVAAQHGSRAATMQAEIRRFVDAAEQQRTHHSVMDAAISDDMADHLRALGYFE